MKQFILSLLLFSSFSAIYAQSSGVLTVTASTSETGGNFAPRNIVAIWVEDSDGNFVKTLLAYAQNRITHLNTWQASTSAAGTEFNTTDAITGATRSSHATRECSWNATDYNGNIVADGEYFVWMELTDKNGTGNYSSFSFTKNDMEELQNPENVPSFSDISIHWTPSSVIIQPVIKYLSLNIRPNPGNGIFIVDGEDIDDIEIRSISGKLIFKTTEMYFDMSDQEKGVYLVIASSKGQRIIKKIVKN